MQCPKDKQLPRQDTAQQSNNLATRTPLKTLFAMNALVNIILTTIRSPIRWLLDDIRNLT